MTLSTCSRRRNKEVEQATWYDMRSPHISREPNTGMDPPSQLANQGVPWIKTRCQSCCVKPTHPSQRLRVQEVPRGILIFPWVIYEGIEERGWEFSWCRSIALWDCTPRTGTANTSWFVQHIQNHLYRGMSTRDHIKSTRLVGFHRSGK